MENNEIEEQQIEDEHAIVIQTEEEIDKEVFALKRLCSNVFETLLQDPLILKKTGLTKNEKDIDYSAVSKSVGYLIVAYNLERLSDIQLDIFESLMAISKTPEKNYLQLGKKFGFDKYYEAANNMIEDAYRAKRLVEETSESDTELKCLMKVLATEDTGKVGDGYRGDYITMKHRENIKELAKKSPSLSLLEEAIWACTGNATNIAEAWINMSDLATLNKIKN